MEIKVCTTNEWSQKEWSTYKESFNAVFKKDYDLSYFKHKYTTALDGHAYHALLLNNEQYVVGGCSVVPFKYKKGDDVIKVGQAVDVFIHEEYRTDLLMLRKMYIQLKKILIANGIGVVIAVPNATTYPYWKNIVKWKDVGDLTYWMLPVRVGNVIKKWSFLNVFSLAFTYLWLGFNAVMMFIANNKEKESLYELVTDDAFCKNRYSYEHEKIVNGNVTFYYRICNEKGVQTVYLLDAKQNDRFSFKALFNGVRNIVRDTNADLILYVGPMKLFQTLLIKVPKKFEPKRLPLTCDILNKEDINTYADMLEYNNWNFGLLNYDVR